MKIEHNKQVKLPDSAPYGWGTLKWAELRPRLVFIADFVQQADQFLPVLRILLQRPVNRGPDLIPEGGLVFLFPLPFFRWTRMHDAQIICPAEFSQRFQGDLRY